MESVKETIKLEIANEEIKLEKEENVAFSNNEYDQQNRTDCVNGAKVLSGKELERIFGPSERVDSWSKSDSFVSEKCSKSFERNRRTDEPPELKRLPIISSPLSIKVAIPRLSIRSSVSHKDRFVAIAPKPPKPMHIASSSKQFRVSPTMNPSSISKPPVSKISSSPETSSVPFTTVSDSKNKIMIQSPPTPSQITVCSTQLRLSNCFSTIGPKPNPAVISCPPGNQTTLRPSQPMTPIYASPTTLPPSMPSASKTALRSSEIILSPIVNPPSIPNPSTSNIALSSTPNPPSFSSPVTPITFRPTLTPSSSTHSDSQITNSSSQARTDLLSSITPSNSNVSLLKPKVYKGKHQKKGKRLVKIAKMPPWASS